MDSSLTLSEIFSQGLLVERMFLNVCLIWNETLKIGALGALCSFVGYLLLFFFARAGSQWRRSYQLIEWANWVHGHQLSVGGC